MIETIRVKEEDLIKLQDELCELTTKAMRSAYDVHTSLKEKEQWKTSFVNAMKKGVSFLACRDADIRGYMSWELKGNRIFINDLMIHPRYQKDGVTLRSILSRFRDEISNIEFDSVIVYTNNQNRRMIQFLKHANFKIDKRKDRGNQYIISKKDFLRLYRK